MDNKLRGGGIAGGTFPRFVVAAAGAPLLLWVLATYGALKPQTVNVHNHAPAVTGGPVVQLPEIKVPPPQIYVQNGDPETMAVVRKELQARRAMLQRAQVEINAEGSQLVRATRSVQPNGTVRTQIESPPIYFSDCADHPEMRHQHADGTWHDGLPFDPGNH